MAAGGAGAAFAAERKATTAVRSSPLTWEAGGTLATAGQWTAGPTRTRLYRPGMPLPGQPIAELSMSNGSAVSTTGTTYITSNLTQNITLQSSASVVKAMAYGTGQVSSAAVADIAAFRLQRGSTALGQPVQLQIAGLATDTLIAPFAITELDFPAALTQQTYAVWFNCTNGGGNSQVNNGGIKLQEIQA